MSIGKNIKLYRKQQQLTQGQLAAKANLSRSYLADLERDRYNPSVDTLKTIAEALYTTTAVLLGENNFENSSEPDIANDFEKLLFTLDKKDNLTFQGKPLNEETKELVRISLDNSIKILQKLIQK